MATILILIKLTNTKQTENDVLRIKLSQSFAFIIIQFLELLFPSLSRWLRFVCHHSIVAKIFGKSRFKQIGRYNLVYKEKFRLSNGIAIIIIVQFLLEVVSWSLFFRYMNIHIIVVVVAAKVLKKYLYFLVVSFSAHSKSPSPWLLFKVKVEKSRYDSCR